MDYILSRLENNPNHDIGFCRLLFNWETTHVINLLSLVEGSSTHPARGDFHFS